MNVFMCRLALMLACVGWVGSVAAEEVEEASKMVYFIAGADSHGPGQHEGDAGCDIMAKRINESVPGMKAVVSRGWPEDTAELEASDAVVIFCDGGSGHLINAHLEYFDTLMKKGVGLMCMHYGVEVPKGKEGNYFLDWIGGYYETNWSINPHWTAEAKPNGEHPVARGVKPFSLRDEWYFNMRWANDDESTVTPILRATPDDEARSGSTTWPRGPKPHIVEASGREETLMWAKERADGGRGIGFTGAHFHSHWQNDDYRKLLLNAVVWIAGAAVPEDGVDSARPSDAEMALSAGKRRRDE